MAEPLDQNAPLGQLLRRQSGVLLLAAGFSGIVNILMLVGPFYMLSAYDRGLGARSEATLAALTILMIICFSVMGVFDYLRTRLMARVAARLSDAAADRIDAQLLTHRADGQAGFWPYKHLDTVHRLIDSPALMSLFDLPWLPIYFGALFIFHPALGWFGLGAAAVLLALSWLERALGRPAQERSTRAQTQVSRLGQALHDNRAQLKAMAMGWALNAEHRRNRGYALRATMAATDLTGAVKGLNRTLRMIAQSGILGLGIWLTLHNSLSGGMILAASVLLGRALAPLDGLTNHFSSLQTGRAAWVQLDRWLEQTRPTPRRKWGTASGGLVLEELTLVPPGARKPALRQINVTVAPGEVLGVIGAGGSGKSAMLAACAGILPTTSGQIRLGGLRLDHLDLADQAAPIGYCPTPVPIFPLSLAANIARLRAEPDAKELRRVLTLTGAGNWADSLPDGLDTILTDSIFLTESQKHSIGLARALYGKPRLVLLDHPDAYMDDQGLERLLEALSALRADGVSTILTTYRPSTLAHCDTALQLANGSVGAQLDAQEFLKTLRGRAA